MSKNGKNVSKHKHELARLIDEMCKVDQACRLNAMKNDAAFGQKIYNHVVYLVDAVNSFRIKELIAKYGYPTKKLVGKKSLANFWLLVQHQDFDLELQKACLEKCDFAPKEKAYLTDRVLVNSGQKQLYGTQFYLTKNGRLQPRPIKDKAGVDKRRKAMGLNSLKEYTKQMRERNRKLK